MTSIAFLSKKKFFRNGNIFSEKFNLNTDGDQHFTLFNRKYEIRLI